MSWYHELPLLIVAFHDSCEKVADIIMVAVPERRYLPPEADETRFISRQVHKFEAVELSLQGDFFSLWITEEQYWLDDIMLISESIVRSEPCEGTKCLQGLGIVSVSLFKFLIR